MNFFLKNKKTIFSISAFSFLLTPLFFVGAYEIRDTETEIKGDFVLEQAKVEVTLNPGDSQIKVLNVLNRTDKKLDFKIEIEDFSGSNNPNETVILKGEEKGPYSLKDYLIPEVMEFSLESRQKMILPVTINIPEDAEPGGLYGSVLISSQASTSGGMGSAVVSRLGALFFVNINGEVFKEGELTSFEKIDSEIGQTSFELFFANTGNVHLSPYGSIKIFNLVGTQIDEVEIPAYFAMPDSLRYRKVEWDKGKLFGRYKAVASINRSYDNKVDEMELVFWVLSQKLVLIILGGILLLILIIIWVTKTFDFNIVKQPQEKELSNESLNEENSDNI